MILIGGHCWCRNEYEEEKGKIIVKLHQSSMRAWQIFINGIQEGVSLYLWKLRRYTDEGKKSVYKLKTQISNS